MGEARRRRLAAAQAPTGHLDVLNVGGGHLTVTFNPANRPELERARRMITDMLRRGYSLFVEGPGGPTDLLPVRAFDESKGVYLIDEAPQAAVDMPGPVVGEPRSGLDDGPESAGPTRCACGKPWRHRGPCLGKGRGRREVPMETARATAVGRSAGG